MRVRETYLVHITAADFRWSRADVPLTASLTQDATATLDRREEGSDREYILTVERTVDPALLEVVQDTRRYRERSDGSREEIPAIRIGDGGRAVSLAGAFLDALAFLTDATINVARPGGVPDTLVPESSEDTATLESLGTSEVHAVFGGSPSIRTFSAQVDGDAIMALLPKAPGLRLYSDALKMAHPVAQFRELWRVLESAFGRKNQRLVALLGEYPPAVLIGFTPDEIHGLWVLRGRASHAESRAGLNEILAVEGDVRRSVARLKSLVERVIMTKEQWGTATLEVRDLLPPSSWVGPGGSIVVVQQPDGPAAA
jgi:hypothetical protein